MKKIFFLLVAVAAITLPSCTVTRPKTVHVDFSGKGFHADSVRLIYDIKTDKIYEPEKK